MALRWLERKPNWLKRDTKDDASLKSQKEAKFDYGVLFIPLRCPRCASKKVKCYGSHPPVRYHYCKRCGYNFKSVEKDYKK